MRTPHAVHVTNAQTPHLFVVRKTLTLRTTMSAQRLGASLNPSTLDGGCFYDAHTAYDYLTQLPPGEHELMFGGGLGVVDCATLDEVSSANDVRGRNVAAYLSGALLVLFGEANWG